MNIQIEAEPWGDMEQPQSFISLPRSMAYSRQSKSFSVSLTSFFICIAHIQRMQQRSRGVLLALSPPRFLPRLYIFLRRGIMRASSDGWPRASHCIGVLWLIELAKWKMKCQQGHAVQQAVSVCLREKQRWTHMIDFLTFPGPCSRQSARKTSVIQ